ncbi:hypothetical protein N7G274_000206 [Stereocaulon virgatum]|uniref:Large ribosomal subunit protein mL67 n=1 Tax=Stereocaulon virgatum TaxID=373712 RepID=A0ABR4AS67_9LECA
MGKLTTLAKTGKTIVQKANLTKDLPANSLLIHKPTAKGVRLPKLDVPIVNHGQYIYIYNNIRTNQVVYSLTRHLNNQDSLAQLPFIGKKTVPARLRKDLWTPFCMVYFPHPHLGLAAYRKLREFRRLHELSYPREVITVKEGKYRGNLMDTKARGKALMDQKANSVADLAAVLLQAEKGPSGEAIAAARKRRARIEHLHKVRREKIKDKGVWDFTKAIEMGGGVQGVMVRWANPLDAEYAETWPEAVVHDELKKSRYTAAFPVVGPAQMVGSEISPPQILEETPEEERKPSSWLSRSFSSLWSGAQRQAVATT